LVGIKSLEDRNKKPYTITLPDSLMIRFDAKVRVMERNRNEVIEEALELYLQKEETHEQQ